MNLLPLMNSDSFARERLGEEISRLECFRALSLETKLHWNSNGKGEGLRVKRGGRGVKGALVTVLLKLNDNSNKASSCNPTFAWELFPLG